MEHKCESILRTDPTLCIYAIWRGRRTGIFLCKESLFIKHVQCHTDGFSRNQHMKFDNLKSAAKYMKDEQLTSTNIYVAKYHDTQPILLDRSNLDQNEECNICKENVWEDDEHLRCDKCNLWHHLSCVNLKKEDIPTGDWFCPSCGPNPGDSSVDKKDSASSEDVTLQQNAREIAENSANNHAEIGQNGDGIHDVSFQESSLVAAVQDPPTAMTKEQENLCTVCKSLEKEVITLKAENEQLTRQVKEFRIKEQEYGKVKVENLRLTEEIAKLKNQITEEMTKYKNPERSHSTTDDAHDPVEMPSVLERLRRLEQKQAVMETTNAMLIKRIDIQEARAGGRGVVNGGEGKGGSFENVSSSKKGGQSQVMVVEEGSVDESYSGEGDKWRVVRRNRRKGKGGNKGRSVSFQVVSDSHGRELGSFLRGAEVDVKGGAKMETVVEGISNGGRTCTVIMGGTNDTTVEGVRMGLSKLRGKMGNSKKVVVVGVPKRYDDPYPNVFDLIKRKNDMIKTFCDIHGYIFLNIDDSKRSFFTKHGLHLNMYGKRWLAEKIQSAVSFLC